MRRNATTWTDEEDDELWQLSSQGISRLRLSVRLGRTDRAIQSRLTLLRKKHRGSSRVEHNEHAVSR